MIRSYYTYVDPLSGRALHAVSRDNWNKILDGYGCANCLEDYHGVWYARCPVCNHLADRDAGSDFVPVIPQFMVPEDYSLLDHPEESSYFAGVRSVS